MKRLMKLTKLSSEHKFDVSYKPDKQNLARLCPLISWGTLSNGEMVYEDTRIGHVPRSIWVLAFLAGL
jgi:hypothetical protein